ncbi:MAG: hypothetical protein K2O18_17050 [Oscillospiraceae bacterium]|nr:hypothetical protein [Oscillospiraceae bacterium]
MELSGPYYVYHIIANFQQRVKLPAALEPVLNRGGHLELSGSQITPAVLTALLAAVRQGKLHNLYLSPFYPMAGGRETADLVNQWPQARYTHGCGVLVCNRDRSAVYLNRLDEFTLNRPVRLQSHTGPLLHPPVIFENHQDMADTVRNFILTGSLDGSRERPPEVSEQRRGVDPNLLFWIENCTGFPVESPEDLKKVTGLTANYYVPGYPEFPGWLAPEPGNWSLLSDLPNLQVLFMPEIRLENWDFLPRCTRLERVGLSNTNLSDPALLENMANVTYLELPRAEFRDYSFLERLSSVEILDLSRTSFRDCALLTRLPQLKRVLLPAERQLVHLELLDALPLQVKTDPRRVCGKEIDSFELIPARPAEPLDLTPPYKVLHIDADGRENEGPEITEKRVKELIKAVKKGKIEMLYASLEPWGEDEYLEIDIADGWAVLNYSDSEADCDYCIYNPARAGDQSDAPPEIGGQSPVPKQHAIEDLSLAADCLGYFIKTGSLYPGAHWAKFYK